MVQVCTVCTHPDKAQIDKALISGESCPKIAARYSTLGRMALQRHKDNHLPAALRVAAEQENPGHAIDVVKQLKAINQASLQVLQEARAMRDHDIQLKAIDRLHKQIELQAKLLGELDDRSQVNILVNPQWVSIRAQVLDALVPYPEARIAVADRLMAVADVVEGMQ